MTRATVKVVHLAAAARSGSTILDVLTGLREGGALYRVAADLWEQSGLPPLRRSAPRTTVGQKTPRLVRSRE